MTQVVRKNEQEALENLIRRFNRKVLQAGTIANARRRQFRERIPSKREQRIAAVRKNQKRQERMRRIYLGR